MSFETFFLNRHGHANLVLLGTLTVVLLSISSIRTVRSINTLDMASFDSNTESLVFGVGSTMSQSLHSRALSTYKLTQEPAVDFVYSPVNSPSGMCRIKDYYSYCNWDSMTVPFADFAVSESVLTPEDKVVWPDLLLMPTVAQGVVMVVNLPGYDPEAPNLILDRNTATLIFAGNITTWNHPLIQALQDSSVAKRLTNETIRLVVRSDVSGTTEVFKKALSSFSPSFEAQIGTSAEPSWPGVPASRLYAGFGNLGVASKVSMNEYSIGYCDLATAHSMGLQFTDFMQHTGAVVTPEPNTIEQAMYEKGMELKSDNTKDLMDAIGDSSWPISTYTYAIIRTNSRGDRLRRDASCKQVEATVFYLEWFLQSSVVYELLPDLHAAHLPQSISDKMVELMRDQTRCEDVLVHPTGSDIVKSNEISGFGSDIVSDTINSLILAYADVNPRASIGYHVNESVPSEEELSEDEAWRVVLGNSIYTQEWFTSRQYNPMHELIEGTDTFLSMPWFLFPVTVVYHIHHDFATIIGDRTLTLDKKLLKSILKGELNSWDNSQLNMVNPWLADMYYDDPLYLFGVKEHNHLVYTLLASFLDIDNIEDAFSIGGSVVELDSFQHVIQAVDATPGSLAIIPYAESNVHFLRQAAINLIDTDSKRGVVLSQASLQSCVGPNSFNPVTFEFTPDHSNLGRFTGCYPLILPVNVVMHYSYMNRSLCVEEISPGTEATSFMRYLFLTGPSLETLLMERMSLPLTWTAGDEAHIQHVVDTLTYMPCGFPIPAENTSQDLIFLIVFMGGGALTCTGLCIGCVMWVQRIKQHKKDNPLYGINIQKILQEMFDELNDMLEGSVCTAYPYLADVEPDTFGIALVTAAGKIYSVGDTLTQFTMEGVCTPLIYAFSLVTCGMDEMVEAMGSAPAPGGLHSTKLNEEGKPFNALSTSGGITCTSRLPFGDNNTRYDHVKQFLAAFTFESELTMSVRAYHAKGELCSVESSISLALEKSGTIPNEYDAEHGLETYFAACSTLVTVVDVATMGAVLAMFGTHPKTKEEIVEYDVCEEVINQIMSCGMFTGGRSWMSDVGFPTKSGLSGGLMGIVPNVCGIGIFSPRVDQNNNSVRGVMAFQELGERLGLSMMRRTRGSHKSASRASGSRHSNSRYSGSRREGSVKSHQSGNSTGSKASRLVQVVKTIQPISEEKNKVKTIDEIKVDSDQIGSDFPKNRRRSSNDTAIESSMGSSSSGMNLKIVDSETSFTSEPGKRKSTLLGGVGGKSLRVNFTGMSREVVPVETEMAKFEPIAFA